MPSNYFDIIKACNARYKALEEEYDNWKDHHKELSEYLMPRKGRFIDRDTTPNDGTKRNEKIINNVAGRSINTAAAGIYSTLSSPAINWFKFGLEDRELLDFAPVREWLEQVRTTCAWMLNKSNFYTAAYATYKELITFGTAFDLMQQDYETYMRFYPFTIGQYYLATDDTGRVNTIYRTFNMTVYQMIQKFGRDNVSDASLRLYENNNTEQYSQVIHLIEPNDDRFDGLTKKKFRSIYYEYEKESDKILRAGGYDEFPGMGPRWDVTGDDVYGMCPGMDVLGDVQMLQKMEDKKLRAIDKMVDPPLNAPPSFKKKAVTSVPGTVNIMGANEQADMIRPTFQVGYDINAAQMAINQTKQDIQEGLFVDLFRMISALNDTPQRTAYEIARKHEEKLQQLGPVVERLQPEFLDKVINRTFDLGFKLRLFPEPPDELRGVDIKIEYESILHQAQKMVGVTSIEQTVGFISNVAQLKPEALDKLDVDETIDQYGGAVNVNPNIIHSDEEVEAVRKQRAEATQKAQMEADLQRTAEGGKLLSEIDTGENNALTQLMGGGEL